MDMTLPESEINQSPPPKRAKLDESSKPSTSSEVGFLCLCDDILLEIFSYVQPTDILALSQCCQRLQCVAFDRTLWNRVDLRSKCLVSTELQKYVKYLRASTTFLATVGPWSTLWAPRRGGEVLIPRVEPQNVVVEPSTSTLQVVPTFTGDLLDQIAAAAPNLSTLILENHIINSGDFTWDRLPHKLEKLSFRGCHIIKPIETSHVQNKSYFNAIDKSLPQLKHLDVTGCWWFESHSFLPLSKCKHLQELHLADCLLFDFVPYVSLGTRFGFKALTLIDLRRTWVSDREVSCLNKILTLKQLYLESPGGERGTHMITDMSITAFGGDISEWRQMGYIIVLLPHFQGFVPSQLTVIEMCKYIGVTDTSLRHCASCLKNLQHINVRGTSCTQAGVLRFKSKRPDVAIVSDFNLEVEPSSSSSLEKN